MSDRFSALDARVRIERRPPQGMVTLRGDLADGAVAAAVAATTGCAVPAVRRIGFAGPNAAAWMSPDELLLLVAAGRAEPTAAALDAALGGADHLAVEVSDARVAFRLAGPGARAVLAAGAPVDLSAGAFGPGDLRRSRLGQVAVAFWCVEPEVFDLVCFRSVADFVAEWLAEAARPGFLPRVL